jgi:transposase InsO family protein
MPAWPTAAPGRGRARSASRSWPRLPSWPSASAPAGVPIGSVSGSACRWPPATGCSPVRDSDLLHLDTKKLGRIVGGPGHRATGDRRKRARGVGWEVLHVAIDDATRLVYAEILPDETGATAAAFTERAVAWFAAQGVTVQRILSDNGSPYVSRAFARTLRELHIKHSRTRPYRPRTNGKVERWIRTVLSECLYLEVFGSGRQRRLALDRFIGYYNGVRPHLGIGGRTPRQRLSEKLAA